VPWSRRIASERQTRRHTTKLLRRGTDIDQAAPWRAVADLKITDVMRPLRPALPVPPGGTAPAAHGGSPAGNGSEPEAGPRRWCLTGEASVRSTGKNPGEADAYVPAAGNRSRHATTKENRDALAHPR
jgi:hypothetical protein